jgi:phosphohistidine phosphatase
VEANMLRLTLIRHAKAQPAQASAEDWERALDVTGHLEAVRMGQRLQRRGLRPTCFASSTATRAVSTAQLLALELGYPSESILTDDRLYLISAPDLLIWIHEREHSSEHLTPHLMIVAHNPGLSDFAARITAHPTADALPTCASYTLRFAIEHWSDLTWGSATAAELDTP